MSAKTQVSFGIVVLSSKLLGKGFRCSVGKDTSHFKFLLLPPASRARFYPCPPVPMVFLNLRINKPDMQRRRLACVISNQARVETTRIAGLGR